jgi:hypothetical protein
MPAYQTPSAYQKLSPNLLADAGAKCMKIKRREKQSTALHGSFILPHTAPTVNLYPQSASCMESAPHRKFMEIGLQQIEQ